MGYEAEYRESIDDPEAFWRRQAENIAWNRLPTSILSTDDNGFYRWFSDGELNTSYLALDFHVEQGRGRQPALIYDSPVTATRKTFTYIELRDEVARFAGALRTLGVEKGDRVIIYMPMIPQALISMLACARLGAIHSVVFGGFSSRELAIRIDDAKPKVLVTASCGIEPGRVVPYKPIVDEALLAAGNPPSATVVVARPQQDCRMVAGRDHEWDALVASAPVADPVVVKATDPLYILYTSGTTGKPKGVVRDNGGHAVAMKYSMQAVYDTQPGDVYWAASDVGWVVGHSYIVYGPLINGCTTILYEGKPVKTPDAGAFWRVIAEHRVKTFFTAPTAFRAMKKEDPDAKLMAGHDLSGLKTVFLAGERLDPPTYEWLTGMLDCPVVDHWWQTETGWPICSNPMGIEPRTPKSGSATLPVPGFRVTVLDDAGRPAAPRESGNICIALPLPPGCLPTLWRDDARFRKAYLSTYEGYYVTADGGYMDEAGYVFVMGRTDDVINVAGHRLSTGEMEELIGSHSMVAECAVVGIADPVKGEVPVAFVVLKDGANPGPEELERALVGIIRNELGAVAAMRRVAIVQRLPKTRSGKILRKTIRQLSARGEVPMPATIDDPGSLDEVLRAMRERHIGRFA